MQNYIDRINTATTVAEIAFLLALAGVARGEDELTNFELAAVCTAAESRLILDCNVDLTPYSKEDQT